LLVTRSLLMSPKFTVCWLRRTCTGLYGHRFPGSRNPEFAALQALHFSFSIAPFVSFLLRHSLCSERCICFLFALSSSSKDIPRCCCYISQSLFGTARLCPAYFRLCCSSWRGLSMTCVVIGCMMLFFEAEDMGESALVPWFRHGQDTDLLSRISSFCLTSCSKCLHECDHSATYFITLRN